MQAQQKPVSFRKANRADIPLLLGLMREFYAYEQLKFHPVAAGSALQGLMDDPSNGAAWLIEWEGQVVGYTVLTVGYSLEFHGADAFIDEIFIMQNWRGKGLGQQAVAFLEEQCRVRGVRALHLEADRKDEQAQAFYRSLSFENHDRHLMTKWL
ncbi:MAG: GNAT family N-acetyltransferase [Acidobacteriales bacterium]|nr:GNAT family N-acetyltransferase [Terriglobales bacterium]